MKNLVCYHEDMDGICCGTAIKMYLDSIPREFGWKNEYVAVQYGQKFPFDKLGINNDVNVHIVDFSYPIEEMMEIVAKAKSVIHIDHHNIEVDRYRSIGSAFIWDNQKSATELTWNRYHSTPIPEFMRLMGERDMWIFSTPDTRALHAGASFMFGTKAKLDDIIRVCIDNDVYSEVLEKGRLIEKFNDTIIASVSKKAVVVTLNE